MKTVKLGDILRQEVCFTKERMDDDEIRETFYLRRLGEQPVRYLCNVHIARIGLIQGTPGEAPRYLRVCEPYCTDLGEAHKLTPVSIFADDSVWWPYIKKYLGPALFAY